MSLRSRATTAALAAACSLLSAPAAALAAAANTAKHGENLPLDLPTQAPQHLAGQSAGGSLMRTFIGLAVVVAVIYGVAWLLRTAKRSKEERNSGTGMRSEAVVALGPNRSLHLVRTGHDLVLLGVAEHGVTPIRTYTEDEARAQGLLPEYDGEADAGAPPAGGWAGHVLDELKRRTRR
jgi:flagellar protein FliO/FliZ